MIKSSINNVVAFKTDVATKDDGAEFANRPRRMSDVITHGNITRKMNLDRRVKGHDRRVRDNPTYQGPTRRLTIDRRLRSKDRRTDDE
jgi:hypothetical protein